MDDALGDSNGGYMLYFLMLIYFGAPVFLMAWTVSRARLSRNLDFDVPGLVLFLFLWPLILAMCAGVPSSKHAQ